MLCSAPSRPSTFTSPTTPCFAETYAALNGEAASPCAEAIAMKRPEPLDLSATHEYLASKNGLVSRRAMSASHLSSGNSSTGATCWNPALATTRSIRPKSSWAASTAARLPSRVVKSASNGSPGPSGSGWRSTARTSIPSLARRSATARPMPEAAPVTTAARRPLPTEDPRGYLKHARRTRATISVLIHCRGVVVGGIDMGVTEDVRRTDALAGEFPLGVSRPPLGLADLPAPEEVFGVGRMGFKETVKYAIGPSLI